MLRALTYAGLAVLPLSGARTPVLVADVHSLPESVGLDPREFVAAGDRLFFTAQDRVHGRELWVSDGTGGGTRLVADLRVGQQGSNPVRLRAVGERVFFFADDGEHGVELWSSEGDSIVRESQRADPGFIPPQVASAGGRLFFATGPVSGLYHPFGWDLWAVGGSVAESQLLNPLEWPGPGFGERRFSRPARLTATEDALFFSDLERVLWISQGTVETTRRLGDFGPDGSIRSVASFGHGVWLTVDRLSDKELWWSDGSVLEQRATVVGGAGAHDFLVAAGDGAYFVAGGPAGVELWRGGSAGAEMVADIGPGPASSFPRDLVVAGGKLFFTIDEGSGVRGLWWTEGEGATAVGEWDSASNPRELAAFAGEVFFVAGTGDEFLWKSDGSPEGTVPLAKIGDLDDGYRWAEGLFAGPGGIFFAGADGRGSELWSSDGTPEGTGLVHDYAITRDGMPGVLPGGSAEFAGTFVFLGDDGIHGEEPWISDGSAAGTRLLHDVRPGAGDSTPTRFTVAGDSLYFPADDGIHGSELWTSPGSGAALVLDIQPGPQTSYIGDPIAFGEQLAFTATGPEGGGLWISDGAGATLIQANVDAHLVALGDRLLFPASVPLYDGELWRSDGSDTVRVKDLREGPLGSHPSWLTRVGDEVVFQANPGSGSRLFRTDGSGAGTRQVAGWEGPGSIYPLREAGGRLFFFPEDGQPGKELWTVENGEARLLKKIGGEGTNGTFGFPADGLVEAAGGQLFFVADEGIHGDELWCSDGTTDGTRLVRDIRAGPGGADIRWLTAVAGFVCFQANDGVHGEELWISDGTRAGTRLLHDLVPGPGGSAPGDLVPIGRRLFFAAVTEAYGREPMVLDVGPEIDYRAWAGSQGLEGAEAVPAASGLGGGEENLLWYAFGHESGASPAGSPGRRGPGWPRFNFEEEGPARTIRLEYRRRAGSGLVYQAEISETLEPGSFRPMEGVETVDGPEAGWERVVVEQAIEAERCFGRIRVMFP